MSFKFEKLIIWQDSMSFGEDIFQVTLSFPKEELYSIRSIAEVVTCVYKAKIDKISMKIDFSKATTSPTK